MTNAQRIAAIQSQIEQLESEQADLRLLEAGAEWRGQPQNVSARLREYKPTTIQEIDASIESLEPPLASVDASGGAAVKYLACIALLLAASGICAQEPTPVEQSVLVKPDPYDRAEGVLRRVAGDIEARAEARIVRFESRVDKIGGEITALRGDFWRAVQVLFWTLIGSVVVLVCGAVGALWIYVYLKGKA